MIDKNRTYTYEELEKLYDEAMQRALEDLDNTMKDTQEKTGKTSGMGLAVFSMQNIMVAMNIKNVLFKGENDETII